LAPGVSVMGGVAIGSARLYDRVASDAYRFHPMSHTHAPRVVAGLERAISLNSALEVDLYGQAYAELGPDALMSGPGGASDFARGVWAGGRFAHPHSPGVGRQRRDQPRHRAGRKFGPVSLGRMDTDVVVTEYGAADLRGLDHQERARALIAVAAPLHRERLGETWAAAASKF
jgi:acyl-CoA hydrolase